MHLGEECNTEGRKTWGTDICIRPPKPASGCPVMRPGSQGEVYCPTVGSRTRLTPMVTPQERVSTGTS